MVIKPMLATAAASLPTGTQWSYEVKWDGYRTIASKDDAAVRLISRNLKNVTARYPAVAAAVQTLRAKSAIVDGEVVAIDQDGRPSFQALQHGAAGSLQLVFFAFDLLRRDGVDLTRVPLEERRAQLADVVSGSSVLLSETLPGTPAQIEKAVRNLGLEGVVAKRRGSRYEPGQRSDAWIKVKFNQRQEFVIGGYNPAGDLFDSILIGYYEGKDLHFAAKVRAGFTPHGRADLFRRIAGTEVKHCPFVNLPNSNGRSRWCAGVTAEDMTSLRWVKPGQVVEVSFVEWTGDALLRHAQFVGLRDDKPVREVRRST